MAEVSQAAPPDVESSNNDKDSDKSSKKKSGLKLNLIVIIVSQLVLAGGGFLMVTQFIKPDPAYQQALEKQAATEVTQEADKAEEVAAPVEAAQRQIYLIEDVIVNPAGTRGSRYLSVSIGAEMDAIASNHEEKANEGEGGEGEGAVKAEANPLDNKKPQLLDALINILSSKTIVELTTLEEKEKIRQEILAKFNEIMAPQVVYQIYFVDFVLQ